MVPRSRSRVIASPVIITIVMVRITPMRPGTMLFCATPFGVVEPVDPHLERQLSAARARATPDRARKGCERAGELPPCDRRRQLAHRGEGGAGRRRVGGIGFDEERGAFAAQQAAGEARPGSGTTTDVAARQGGPRRRLVR